MYLGYITFELGPKIWHLETNKKAVIDLIIKLIKYVNDCVAEDSTTFEAGRRWRQTSKNNAILVFLPGKNSKPILFISEFCSGFGTLFTFL